MTDANIDDVFLNFIQNEVSQNAEIRTMSLFCRDFISAHPHLEASEKQMYYSFHRVLRNIPHEKYDDTTLAKMLFCLSKPLASVNLKKVKERLEKNGILRLDQYSKIRYYKNDEVELKGAHGRKNQIDRAQVERARRESQASERERFASLEIKFERQMEEEAREMGEREKAKENALKRAEEERIRMHSNTVSNEDWGFDDPNIPSTSDHGSRPRFAEVQNEEEEIMTPVTKKARVEPSETAAQEDVHSILPESPRPQSHEVDGTDSFFPIRGFDDLNSPLASDNGRQRPVEVQTNEEEEDRTPVAKSPRVKVSGIMAQENWSALPEPSRSQIHEADSTSSFLSIGASPAPDIFRIQEASYGYFTLMKSIHDFTLVLEDPSLESLRAEVVEELVKPESVQMKIAEGKISEALDEGMKIVAKYAKSDNLNQSFGFIEFMRFMKLYILNIGFPNENEYVTKITKIINESSHGMMIPMSKVRFAMETIFEKVRQ